MNGDPIIEALEGQLGCYRRLAKLADLQHEHVRQSRTEQLLEVLASRQTVLEQVAAFEQVVGPAKKQWAQYLASLDESCRARAESLLAETRRILEQITAADRDDTLVLQQRKINLGREINKASSARQFNRSYAAAAYGRRPSSTDVQL
jgi:hypothetical protein